MESKLNIMPQKHKKRPIDWGQVIGATIFITLFIGLIIFGLLNGNDAQFQNSFFEDIGNVMDGQY
ncbi:hypothetical protein MNBD_GAMMA07-644 [hydrothermal vent metagenome]|uniref:Uncharacterized protein n=1 Tax=hydrothermal vent metagenome TaxID=652676 RepID=A0A3B0WE71_9ZZZZ